MQGGSAGVCVCIAVIHAFIRFLEPGIWGVIDSDFNNLFKTEYWIYE